jgi:hypothetical protein
VSSEGSKVSWTLYTKTTVLNPHALNFMARTGLGGFIYLFIFAKDNPSKIVGFKGQNWAEGNIK